MIKIKSAPHIGTNAWGGESRTFRTIYQIEQSDVGTKRENKGGHRQPAHTFTRNDIGRCIEVITDGTDYTCWYFLQPTTHGTSYFVDRIAAFNYYSAQGYTYTRDEISQKIAAGEISTGEPPLQKGDTLSVIAGEGRYQITSYKGCI